ncbi:MAG: sulfatase [Planctomycetota bacterium]
MKQSLNAVLVGTFTLLAYTDDARTAEEQRPNVLMIAVDDLNHWVGYLGRNKQTITPNIDRLAKQGASFTRSYCAAPVCNPSRAALLSGMRPATTGVYGNNDDWRNVVPPERTLITTFRNAGYYTAGAGKIYHGGFDRQSEWDDYLQDEGPSARPKGGKLGVGGILFAPVDGADEDVSDARIVAYGIEQLQKKHDKPFFLSVGLHKPHMPWYVPKKYYDMHPLDSIELPPVTDNDLGDIPPAGQKMANARGDHAEMLRSGRWKEAIQGYLAAVSYSDAMIGRLLDALKASEYRDNTIVVLWGDHGWHLGEKEHWRKFALWEEATRAPLLWVVPGLTKPNGVCERTVDFMSIYPTLCDLAGIPIPSHVEGKSIRSLLANPKSAWNTPALTTYEFNNHAVRSEGHRYIRYHDGGEELYDETKDPYEWTNLANQPDLASIKAELVKFMPKENAADIGGKKEAREGVDGKKAGKDKLKKKLKKAVKKNAEN